MREKPRQASMVLVFKTFYDWSTAAPKPALILNLSTTAGNLLQMVIHHVFSYKRSYGSLLFLVQTSSPRVTLDPRLNVHEASRCSVHQAWLTTRLSYLRLIGFPRQLLPNLILFQPGASSNSIFACNIEATACQRFSGEKSFAWRQFGTAIGDITVSRLMFVYELNTSRLPKSICTRHKYNVS